jgi:alanine-glyoxylate transaminase/serine-glyoxylate transaminase/serine-pyruvate transaminase
VLQAMAYPLVGHLDRQFLNLMQETQALLRHVFQTKNELTIPISGTGSAGMEAALCNFLEPGEPVLICVNGYFGERMCNMAARYGAMVHRLARPWGEVFTVEEIGAALQRHPAKLVAIVHGETSTGALQPLVDLAPVVHDHNALLMVDCVTSLGGVPVQVDEWGIDIAYSGTQKCLGVPPGLAPLTVSPRAQAVLRARNCPVANWYLDLTMISQYWGQERTYHHTAPISMNYALYEGLIMIREEGLQTRWARHQANAEYLWSQLTNLGLDLVVSADRRLPSLTTVQVPVGLDEAAVRQRLLHEYQIEIGGGLGPFAGKVWRIGLMGYSSQQSNVDSLIRGFQQLVCI